jgi:hypothetical protein
LKRADVRQEQVLGRIFPNLGQLETNATLVHKADEWAKIGPFRPIFVSYGARIGRARSANIDGFNGTLPFWGRHLQRVFQCADLMTKTSLIDGFGPSLCILAFPNIENDIGAK